MPTPIVDEDTREFWDASRAHRLIVQQCSQCDSYRFAPAPICFSCHSRDFRWVESEGIGEVYTWTVTYRPVHSATEEAAPYNSVVVKLADCGGAMLVSNLIGVDNDDIHAGMKVAVEWDDITPEISVPRFRPL
jgi:uncharacterized OB-fold protein